MDRAGQNHRILLTGRTGQLGSELLRTLEPFGEIVAPSHAEMDLANASSIREVIRLNRPRWIVNPAAFTAVDLAEGEPDRAYAINSEAIKVMGEEARSLGAGVIHFSTDYVFDGSGSQPYREGDPTGPLGVYGASKLAGEEALAASGASHLIFRTSWVYGATGKNFLRTILRLAEERETLRIVADQYGAPTWSRDLARMTAAVLEQCEVAARGMGLSEGLAEVGGIYHAAGRGETTWHGFAAEAVRLRQQTFPDFRLACIEPITTAEYATPAKRPANSRMDSGKLRERFGWTMMDWHDSLHEVLSEIGKV